MAKKIYFKNPNTENLDKLIESLFTKNVFYAKNTYLDSEFKYIECTRSRRSFEDLLLISKTYFPRTKKKELMQALINNKILFYRCSEIKKIVFHYCGDFSIERRNFLNFKNKGLLFKKETHKPEQLHRILKQTLKEMKKNE
jgi:heme oxygenase